MLEGRSGSWTGGGTVCYYVWDVWEVGVGGWRPAAHRRLETVKDGWQACTPESGKEKAEESGLGRARVEEEEKVAASGKTGKRLLCKVAPFQILTIQAKLWLF